MTNTSPFIHLQTSIPGPRSQALMAERRKHVARGPFHATPVFVQRAHGALIEDVDGNTLIDLAAGIGVANVGHCPDPLVSAIQAQAGRVLHAGFNVTPYESYVNVSEALNQATPGGFDKKTLLVNSGAEAVENAVKIARAFTQRQAVVCFDHAYHGRTYMAMSLTAKVKPYKLGFAPFNPEVYRAPFPYAYRWPTGSGAERVSNECFQKFEELVNTQIGAHEVAAVIIEPVLGEGGFVPAPPQFLAKLREFCTANGIVLIADEIQTGFGRTGTLFACEQLGLVPDLMTLAKGLAGGLPLAAVVGRAEIMDAPMEGGIGGTYGGNPVACASALEVFATFRDGKTLPHAQSLAPIIQAHFKSWMAKYPVIGDARGLGPMQGLEFVKDRATKEPHRDAAAAVARYCYEHGVVVLTAGTFGNVIRLLPPLVIEQSQLEEALAVLEAGIQSVR